MIRKKELEEIREDILRYQDLQDRLFKKALKKMPPTKREKIPGFMHLLEDFLYNNVYYKNKEKEDFLEELIECKIVKDN